MTPAKRATEPPNDPGIPAPAAPEKPQWEGSPIEERPSVDEATRAVFREVQPIAKNRTAPDEIGAFKFRGIEDALAALHPLCAKHGLIIQPMLLKREREELGKRYYTYVEVSYMFVGPNGTEHVYGPFPGEGVDSQDKGANKAMSGAWKLMAFEVFQIPVAGASEDAEADHYDPRDDEPPSVQEQWERAEEKVQQRAEEQQERLDNLPEELHDKVLERMTSRVNGEVQVSAVRDIGPGWLNQFTKVLDMAWAKADEGTTDGGPTDSAPKHGE